MKLKEIQTRLKSPKNQFNKFGNYKYRNQEDILESVKPLLDQFNCVLTLTDEIKELSNIRYTEATATLHDIENNVTHIVKASAGIDPSKKGMSIEQVFGSSSSYARKYALAGLFLLDDTKDSDATNTHGQEDEVGNEKRDYLISLLDSSTYEDRQKLQMQLRIEQIIRLEDYERAKLNLEANQAGYDGVVNPNSKDINKHLKKKTSE